MLIKNKSKDVFLLKQAGSDVDKSLQLTGYQVSKPNIPEVWSSTMGEGITVAVLDTGCQITHPDIKNAVLRTRSCINSAKIKLLERMIRDGKLGKTKSTISKSAQLKIGKNLEKLEQQLLKMTSDVTDVDSHGTFVSSEIVAESDNFGIVGVAPKAKLMVVKVLRDDGSGSFEDVAAGINFAVANKADVISLSLGSSVSSPLVLQAIKNAYNKQIPVICAAGNSGNTGKLDYPAQYSQTISVGAINRWADRASFSQTGSRLDFVMYGTNILGAVPTDDYAFMSGTSMATPIVAGIVALLLSKHRNFGGNTPINNVEDIRQHLAKICIDLGDVGKDSQYGFGLIDASKL